MLYRPLILAFALVAGDYAMWTWSVGDGHDVVASISGFAMAPLSIAFVWLLARSVLRVLGRAARAPGRTGAAGAAGTQARGPKLRRRRRSAKMLRAGSEDPAQAASGSTSSSAKIAA
jgi:hypothetical protein